MTASEEYIFNQQEPFQSIMLRVRAIIFNTVPIIEEKLNYKIPFYNYNNKPVLYLNVLKNTNYVDIAFVQGVLLEDSYPQLKNYKNRKQVRSLQIKSLTEFNEQMFAQLLQDAVRFIEISKKPWFI